MRHTTKYKQWWETWDIEDYTFDATVYRAKLDSNQVTVVIEQDNHEIIGKSDRWKKSFRGNSPTDADNKAKDYIELIKHNSQGIIEDCQLCNGDGYILIECEGIHCNCIECSKEECTRCLGTGKIEVNIRNIVL